MSSINIDFAQLLGYDGFKKNNAYTVPTGLIVALGKIKHFFKAPFFENKPILMHLRWFSAWCKTLDNGIDLT